MSSRHWSELALPEYDRIVDRLDERTRAFMTIVIPGFIERALNDPWQQATADERSAWEILTSYRCINDFNALPLKIQQELVAIRNYVTTYDPQAAIKLAGSWPNGTWADECSGKVFRAMRTLVRKKPDLSDLDIVINSDRPFTRKELQCLTVTKIDLWKVSYGRITGIEF